MTKEMLNQVKVQTITKEQITTSTMLEITRARLYIDNALIRNLFITKMNRLIGKTVPGEIPER